MKPWFGPALVGILVRVASLLPLDPLCQRDECQYLDLAKQVAAGEMLGMAGEASGRFWLWAPGYPYLLGATEWLTGDAEWFKLVQVLSFPVLAWLGWLVAGKGSAGRMTAWLLALHPTLAYFAGHIWSETVYITLLFALLAALGWSRKGGAARGLLPGFFVGLSVLMRGAATYMLPVLLLGRLWGRWRSPSAWGSCGVLVLGAALTVAPWSMKASAHYDGFVLSDASLGQMMWLGNNDFDPVSFDLNLVDARERFEDGRPHCPADEGLLAWDACEVEAGKQWIREHPEEFVRRVPLRISQLFNPNSFLTRALRQEFQLPGPVNEGLSLLVVAFSFLAVLGGTLGGVARGRGWLPVTVAGLIVYQVATVSILAGLSRYRLPLDAMWLMGAALLLTDPKGCLAALRSWRGLLAAALCVPMVAAMCVFLVPSFGHRPPDSALPPGGERPDIVLISIDTLRADHLGAWGYERPTSPNLDALAARGTRFAMARSPSPWTLPSHTTMLTGLLPLEHGVVDDRSANHSPMVQSRLQEAGYATAGFVTSIFVGRRYGFDTGFDDFTDFGVRTKKSNLERTPNAERLVNKALDWLQEREGESAFVFLHLYDVHYPYDAPDGFDRQFDRPSRDEELTYKKYFHYLKHPLSPEQMEHQKAQYDEEIAYVDQQLGRLIEAYGEREVIFIVTADHGEEFGERGSWGHGHTLGPEQLHVPLIISGAGPAGVVETAVGLQDIAPTLAELGGVEALGSGMSLVPALSGEPLPERAFVCDTSRFSTNRLGVYEAGDRVDWDLSQDLRVLTSDPGELLPVQDPVREQELLSHAFALLGSPWSAQEPVSISRGVALIDGALSSEGVGDFAVVPSDAMVGEWSVRTPPPADAGVAYRGLLEGGVDLSPEERQALEALGYIQGDP